MLFLVMLVVVSAGCSSVRFTYHHGDTLMYWWLNSYLDLEDDQKPWVKQEIDKLFQWHRSTQLREYAAMLSNWQRQLAGTPTQADLLADYKDIKGKAEVLAMYAVPDMAELAREITPDQIAHIERKFAKNNDDFRKKYMSGDLEHQRQVRYQKAMDQLELWFGSFSRDQEAVLRRASDGRPNVNDVMFQERKLRQQKILGLLRRVHQEKLNKEQTMAAVRDLMHDLLNRDQSPERKAFYDAYAEDTAKFIGTAIRIATPDQKAHAQQRMQGWINDFNALAAGQ
jgi:hypothetical protein